MEGWMCALHWMYVSTSTVDTSVRSILPLGAAGRPWESSSFSTRHHVSMATPPYFLMAPLANPPDVVYNMLPICSRLHRTEFPPPPPDERSKWASTSQGQYHHAPSTRLSGQQRRVSVCGCRPGRCAKQISGNKTLDRIWSIVFIVVSSHGSVQMPPRHASLSDGTDQWKRANA